jgi:hypothetical protein
MSRYLAFVLLALSASVLAAPAELPQMPGVPDTTTVTRPVLGERSNGKVYSPIAPHKRDYLHPESTKDCHLSEVSKDSTVIPYTHDGQAYSETCMTQLAFSVPPEHRESCRTTGTNARGYDEQCLFKKAFAEDWKFNMEEARRNEAAYRSLNPNAGASDFWRYYFPATIADCSVPKDKVVSSRGWTPYSITPQGVVVDNECAVRLLILAEVTVTVGICSAEERLATDIVDLTADITADITAVVNGLQLVDVDVDINAAVSLLVALRTGCILSVISRIIATIGVDVSLLGLAVDLIALLDL